MFTAEPASSLSKPGRAEYGLLSIAQSAASTVPQQLAHSTRRQYAPPFATGGTTELSLLMLVW